MRKGYIHTLEAVLAMFLVFSYYTYLVSSIEPAQEDLSAIEYFQETLESLERNGNLGTYAVSENVTAFETAIENAAPARFNVEVEMRTLNATTRTVSSSTTPTTQAFDINITDNWIVDNATLTLWISNITDARVEINGAGVFRGEGNKTVIGISSDISDGNNTINITSGTSAELRYEIAMEKRKKSGITPAYDNVRVSTYLVSGTSTRFKPTEMVVYYWRLP